MKPETNKRQAKPNDLVSIIREAKRKQAAERTRAAAIFCSRNRRKINKKTNNWIREVFLSSFKREANQSAREGWNLIHLFDKSKKKLAIKRARAEPIAVKDDETADHSAYVKVQCDFGETQLKPNGQTVISRKRKSSDCEIYPVEIVKKSRLDESIQIAIGETQIKPHGQTATSRKRKSSNIEIYPVEIFKKSRLDENNEIRIAYKSIDHSKHKEEEATSPTISLPTQQQPSQSSNELILPLLTATQELFEAPILPVNQFTADEARNVNPLDLAVHMDCEENDNANEVLDVPLITNIDDESTNEKPLDLHTQMVGGPQRNDEKFGGVDCRENSTSEIDGNEAGGDNGEGGDDCERKFVAPE